MAGVAGRQQLYRYVSRELRIEREPDFAMPAASEPRDQTIPADGLSGLVGLLVRSPGGIGKLTGKEGCCRRREEILMALLCLNELLHFLAQPGIARARFRQIGRP